MEPKVDPVRARSDELHRRIAAAIRRDPTLIDQAKTRVARWIARDAAPHAMHVEWRDALAMLDADEIAQFLESPLPRAVRMRSASPFAGLVP